MFPTLLACAAVQSYPQAQPGSADSASPEAVRSAEGPVVIIGGGPSGMAAAMDLEGAVLFEGSDRLGGRAPGIGQLMYFVGTEEQRQHGVEDSIEQALEDWPLYTGSAPTQATEDFLRGSHEVRDRLVDLGLSFSLSPPDEPLRRQRNHGALAPGLPATLEAALPADLDLRLETRVEDLWIEDGQVLGVLTQDGPQPASAVIIASGGFAGRQDLLQDVLAWDPGRWRPSPGEGAEGAALDWARAHGLGSSNLEDMGALVEALGVAGTDGLAIDISRAGPPDWVFVDSSGARFVDEGQDYSLFIAGAIQLHEPVWQLMAEETLLERLPAGEEHAMAAVPCSEDPIELAEVIAVDGGRLIEALESTRAQQVRSGARICAFPPGFVAAKGFGGLTVDHQQQVLDADGQPIPGLYAVGEAAGMAVPGLGGSFGFDGSLSAVVWSGWRAAEAIASRADGDSG
jgi:succinate dehydrogenase/fumarate reductase flavoprotein subunit